MVGWLAGLRPGLGAGGFVVRHGPPKTLGRLTTNGAEPIAW